MCMSGGDDCALASHLINGKNHWARVPAYVTIRAIYTETHVSRHAKITAYGYVTAIRCHTRIRGVWLMPFNSYSTSASTRQNFFPLSHPPSAPLPHSYLSFLVGVRQINVNAGFTYHTVASTTLQATEWEQTAIQSTLGASKVVLQLQDTCKHCMATYWLAPFY